MKEIPRDNEECITPIVYCLSFEYNNLRGREKAHWTSGLRSRTFSTFEKKKMSKGFEVVPLKEEKFDSAIEFLRENFFPEEPCAQAIDLCPLGYR